MQIGRGQARANWLAMPLPEPDRAAPLLALQPKPVEEPAPDPPFTVRLDKYEGPLDALLDLVKRQGLDILDLPIALITEQYLESLRLAKALDVEVGAEFADMAATLILIKAKALLPSPPAAAEPAADPGDLLVEMLLERETFKQAAQMLEDRRIVEENTWTIAEEALCATGEDPPELRVSLFDLVQAFGSVLERLSEQPTVEIPEERVTVASRIHLLKAVLADRQGPVRLKDLLRQQPTADAVIATFLALLELVKAGAARLRQGETYGEITLWRPVAASAENGGPATGGRDGSEGQP